MNNSYIIYNLHLTIITYIFYFYPLFDTGFHQPDEDDYGYVSKDAMDIYNNIINKYVNTPADSRSSKTVNNRSHDISGTKVSILYFNNIFNRRCNILYNISTNAVADICKLF